MFTDETDYNQFDALADELEEAEEEGRCVFDEDDECQLHHSYLSSDSKCLWAVQHKSETNG